MPSEHGAGAAFARAEASALTPRDPDWRARVERIFATAPFVKLLGIEMVSLEPGEVVAQTGLGERHCQHDGFVHAGVQATLADHSAGGAAASLVPAGFLVLTAEFKISLLRPAKGERLLCRARVVKTGRMLSFCQSEVFALAGERESHVASVSVTIAHVTGKAKG
ncbi:PaaI family thioesterase [Afifella pfennigii]|uniref:PaaI family thioesterase n=1 Tax=Afifella pfennigii TaxID=209897 RepID=UPI0009FD13FA|nr:PaaI family thioesterase [Afifella pfennigii]